MDLNAKPGDELYPAAPTNAPSVDLSTFGDGIVHEKDAEESMGNMLAETESNEAETRVIAVAKDVADEDDDEFGSSGPFIM